MPGLKGGQFEFAKRETNFLCSARPERETVPLSVSIQIRPNLSMLG